MMLTPLIVLTATNFLYLALHVSESGSFPRALTAAKEREYLIAYQDGDMEARAKLIEHNLRLVAHIVKKYYSAVRDQDDLISVGTIGLIKAVSTFDGGKGTRLATYAARCIENEILMYFRNQKKSAQDMLISEPIDTDNEGNTLTLIDVIAEDDCIADCIDLKVKSEHLRKYIDDVLTPRERMIIKLRYGLAGGRDHTQQEVAQRMGISRSYVYNNA